MGRIGPLSQYGAAYEAYAGPETGGFNVLPQSAVPQLDGVSEDARQYYLGGAGAPLTPHPVVGKYGAEGATRGAPMPQVRSGRLGLLKDLLPQLTPRVPTSGLTVAPKGGVPREGTANEAAVMGMAEPFMQPKDRFTQADAIKRAAGNQGIKWLINMPNVPGRIINAAVGVDVVPDIVTAQPDEIRAAFTPKTAMEERARSEQLAGEYPLTTAATEIGSDVAAVSLLRQPALGPLRAREIGLVENAETAAWKKANLPPERIARTGQDWWAKKIDSPRFFKLQKGGGRIAETTAEGLVIGAINDSNPITTAAMGAVGQAGGSGILHLAMAHGPTNSKVLNLGIKAVAAGTLVQLLTGGFSLPDLETGFTKVKLGLGAAIIVGTAGAGRMRTQDIASLAPRLLDTVASVPRQSLLSFAAQYQSAKPDVQGKVRDVLSKMQGGAYTVEQMEMLGRAFDKGGEAFLRVIERM